MLRRTIRNPMICKDLKEHCQWLNDAHKRADHSELEKQAEYQQYIGEMNQLNKIAKKMRLTCKCKQNKSGKKHIGHRMVK